MDKRHQIILRITSNGMIAALYFALTMLFMTIPVISQFGPIQIRFSEFMVLLAFFRPDLTFGLSLGCFFANMAGFFMGYTIPADMVLGTLATALACVAEAYLARHLLVACIYPVIFNGVIVGLELYYLMGITDFNPWVTMGLVAAGEAAAIAVGYALFMVLMRNKGFMRVLAPTRHQEARF